MAGSVAYLVGNYPTVSHTFITREVDGLRASGVDVQTFSIRRTPPEQLLTDADRRAAAQTSVILPPPPGELLGAHLRALVRRPGRYLATLTLALRLSAGGVRNGVWQLFYFAEAILLAERLRRRGIGHVHAHFANVATAVALLAAHHRDGLTWSFTMHGPSEFDDVTRYAVAEKVRRAAFVACIGDYCRSQLMKLVEPAQWPKLAIVHCGVDPRAFTPAERAGRPGLCVLCVGRLVPDKGQSILLDALAELRRRGIALTATFAGDGPDRPALQAQTSRLGLDGAVEFAGAVGQDRIRELYAAADVFCLPSFAEGVPVVLMEAMATGLPVVTTRIMGIPELVEHGVAGVLVAPGRSDELAGALEALAGDPERRAAMGRAGRAKVLASYDIEQAVIALQQRFAQHA